jgi:tRNA(Ile)-lysidine synthase
VPVTGGPPDQGADAGLLRAVSCLFPPDACRIGVAVSGGGDSMALLHLLHRAAAQRGFALSAVTVDHRLRPESAAEAAGVAAFCASLGVAHDTLVWDHGPIPGNLMDQARRARIALMADWAQARGIGHIALGHTADDQAETFLMGLARASGLDGLSGMRHLWHEAGVWWGRPLLDQSRAQLRAYLGRQAIGWIDDPTNDDIRRERTRARRALAALAPLGITADRLAITCANLAMAQSTLQDATHKAANEVARECCGALDIDRAGLAGLPQELRRRLLITAIRWMNGAAKPLREDKLAVLQGALSAGRDATLGGVRFRPQGGQIKVTREARAVMGPVPVGGVWDHRWQVVGPAVPDARIAALGADGLRQCPDWRRHGPREALIVSPALWLDRRLIAAPLAGLGPEWQASLGPTFTSFILSH